MPSPSRLPRKPEARTERVEELVERVLQGTIRVPRFQRGLKWKRTNVVELFDSIYRGYPVGSLLFYKKAATADHLSVGPIPVEAPETPEAWWVVDGQQRVTALVACLARQTPSPARPSSADPYVLYFDSKEQQFEPPQPNGEIPTEWVPVPYLLDASQLTEWVFRWEHRDDEALRRAVFEAGSRIREYAIPLYLIATDDTKIAMEIFYRVNQSGVPLEWPEVHKALFGEEGSAPPTTLGELSGELAVISMGQLEEKRLLTCLFALRGKDPTRNLAEYYRQEPDFLRDAVQESLPVLRRVLSFLRRDAGVPHLRLLPKSILLDVLTRFFAVHANPLPRTRILLARWFWRTILGAGAFDDRTLRRRGIQAVSDDEEGSVQALLSLVRKDHQPPIELPQAFDPRSDDSRLALLTLAHLNPRDLLTGQRLDIAGLLENDDRNFLVKAYSKVRSGVARGPANRLIQEKSSPIDKVLSHCIATQGIENSILASHAIDPKAAEAFLKGDSAGFLKHRSETLTEELRRFCDRMAAWDHSDRPSVDYLLAEAGVGA